MKRITVLLATIAMMLGMLAGPAMAQPGQPQGQGLATETCAGELGDIVLPRGSGGPGWTEDGTLWIVVSGTGTFGEETFSFTQGQKVGLLDETATCTIEDGPGTVTLTVVRVR